jgi:hypothetical protein
MALFIDLRFHATQCSIHWRTAQDEKPRETGNSLLERTDLSIPPIKFKQLSGNSLKSAQGPTGSGRFEHPGER